MSKPLFVVAIDFGTTFSGYAYSSRDDYQDNPTKVFAYEKWTACGQGLSKKTSTCLLLKPTKEFCAFGYEAEDEYNALALRQEHKPYYFYKRFKMKLYGEEVFENFDEDITIEDQLGKPLPAIDIFSESIKYLKDHFLDEIKTIGIKIRINEICWVLTVPAIWNDSAKFFMRKAAVKFTQKQQLLEPLNTVFDILKAGINGRLLKIALEPEAASIFCQHLKTERAEDASLTAAAVGIKYMVIDLGGGTVDLTVHEKLDGGKLKELHKASGGAWGGIVVDQQFINLLTKIVGGPVMHRFLHENTLEYCEMMREFEVTKRGVSLDNSKCATKKSCATTNIRVPVALDEICVELNGENILSIVKSENFPCKENINKIGDKLVLNKELIREMFMYVINPIVKDVIDILRHEDISDVSLIILAGGFAESQIVQQFLRKELESKDRKLIVSQEAGVSVLKGAVMFGHRPDGIKSRILRYTYGIMIRKPFDPDKHPQSKKCPINGKEYCMGLFHRFITKGTSVEKGLQIEDSCVFVNDNNHKYICMYSSKKKTPVFTDEKGCNLIKKIDIISKLPNSNKSKYQLHFTYTFGDTEVELQIEEKQLGFVYNDTLDFQYQ